MEIRHAAVTCSGRSSPTIARFRQITYLHREFPPSLQTNYWPIHFNIRQFPLALFLLHNHTIFIRFIQRNNVEANPETYQKLRGLIIYFCDNFRFVKFDWRNLKHIHSRSCNNSKHRPNTEQYSVRILQVSVSVQRCSLRHDGDTKRYENTSIFSKVIGSDTLPGHTSITPHIYIILQLGKYVNIYARRRLQDGIHNIMCKTTQSSSIQKNRLLMKDNSFRVFSRAS